MSTSTKSRTPFTPAAAVLGWLWPGLGQISLGERRRGLLVMFGVLLLFSGGVLIGGVDVVDRRDDRLWFCAQILCGPVALAVDLLNQNLVERLPEPWVERYERRDPEVLARIQRKSLGHVNEFGTLYTALAGLMNLVAILDALQAPRRGEGR